MTRRIKPMTMNGREFKVKDIKLIKEIVSLYPNLSRYELASTICEIIDWHQSNGKPKFLACLPALEKLESYGYIKLPELKESKLKGFKRVVKITSASSPCNSIVGEIKKSSSIVLEKVPKKDVPLWKEYIERYHYLRYKTSFGSQLKYFIRHETDELLGCLLFSASAWSVSCRDKWIGWDKKERSKRLHLIINNSRFLIFPWVKLKYLASKVLSLVVRQLADDWEKVYKYHPVMLETFVDRNRFKGTCYRAANWECIGITCGRGRMDRHKQYLSSPKDIYIYPLCVNFREELCGQEYNV